MTHRGAQERGCHILDFVLSSVGTPTLERVRALVSPTTILRTRTLFPLPRDFREMVIFVPFLMVWLVPALSPFFVAVLEVYAIHLVHLTPNVVLTLVLFVHTYEMFVGVQPSVELFRHFFNLCCSGPSASGPSAAP